MVDLKARLFVLETLVGKLYAERAFSRFGVNAPDELNKSRRGLWNGFEQWDMPDDDLTEAGRAKMKAEIQAAFERILSVAVLDAADLTRGKPQL